MGAYLCLGTLQVAMVICACTLYLPLNIDVSASASIAHNLSAFGQENAASLAILLSLTDAASRCPRQVAQPFTV